MYIFFHIIATTFSIYCIANDLIAYSANDLIACTAIFTEGSEGKINVQGAIASICVTRIHDVTNMFVNFEKYVLHFWQIHSAIWTDPEVSTRVTPRQVKHCGPYIGLILSWNHQQKMIQPLLRNWTWQIFRIISNPCVEELQIAFLYLTEKHIWVESLVPLTLVRGGSPNPPLGTNGQGTPAADIATLKIWSHFLRVHNGKSNKDSNISIFWDIDL